MLSASDRAPQTLTQQAFDRLSQTQRAPSRKKSQNKLGQLDDLQLKSPELAPFSEKKQQGLAAPPGSPEAAPIRTARKEKVSVYENLQAKDTQPNQPQIAIFESEVDPMEMAYLESGHLILYRKVWKSGQRTIQGLVLAEQPFIQEVIAFDFHSSALASMSNLVISLNGEIISILQGLQRKTFFSQTFDYQAVNLRSLKLNQNTQLYRTALQSPFDRMKLVWTINQLPAAPGANIIYWSATLLLMMLLCGFFILYTLGKRQIMLTRQQQDFISSVSHELKTPLTSIRMFSEMLKSGWVPAEKQPEYFNYIHNESERLSRLINNVLQLARLERNELQLELKPVSAGSLMDMIKSRCESLSTLSGFDIHHEQDERLADIFVSLDTDAFIQIILNILDNAIKFSAKADCKRIIISTQLLTADSRKKQLEWKIRDFGPGIPQHQLRKIFDLFYRSGDEMTRETQGTGIGLALVNQLASSMNGQIKAENAHPGALFILRFPVASRAHDE